MRLLITSFFLFLSVAGIAQTQFVSLDKSPMDMCYYPDKYPSLKVQNKPCDPVAARVIYSRPQKNNRVIFGDLVEYGKVWRLGANEATEIEFYKPVKINNIKIKKGRYTMYCTPFTDKWIISLNKETDTWGAFNYDSTKNIASITLPVQKQTDITEALSMIFEKSDTGANLLMAWDDVKVSLPIVF